jgi:hypothetical protein
MDKQKLDALRKRAETILGSESDDFSGSSEDELRMALHELHTHQIELELQNEELRRVQEELVETRDREFDQPESAKNFVNAVAVERRKGMVVVGKVLGNLVHLGCLIH